jgi:phage terminase large subunit-like protein
MVRGKPKLSLDEAIAAAEILANRKRFEAWRYFSPVPKQIEFFAGGKDNHERLLMAGNGNGKTESAAYEVSRHLTCEYPPWWPGRVYNKPITMWIAGASAIAYRDAAQKKLCGQPGVDEAFGTGMIPREAFVEKPKTSRGAPDAYDSMQVRCKPGGRLDESAISRVVFKTYSQEREDWQGPDIDVFWADEEPPETHYSEGLARLRGRGMSLMTFTPLLGPTAIVLKFLETDDVAEPGRILTRMGINDALWYSEEERRRQIMGYPVHEREARANGTPLLGEGAIFATPIDDLLVPPVSLATVPIEWRKIWGLDFGIDHPFAAVLLAWDTENAVQGRPGDGPVGTVYALASIRMRNATPLVHAAAMKRIAADVPVAWPHDGHVRDRGSGEALSKIYIGEGLKMLPTHATHPTGGFSTEAGVADLNRYMEARQFKVSDNQPEWKQEYGTYHRKKGMIVKVNDDLMSATRIGMMMRRYARAVPLGGRIVGKAGASRIRIADGVDYDLFA